MPKGRKMQLNGTKLTDRYNRPSVLGKTALRVIFMNDGTFVDPYDVSSCIVFNKLANAAPSSILDAETSLIKDSVSSLALMAFSPSGETGIDHDGQSGRVTSLNLGWVAESSYTPAVNASGIYRTGVGEYVAVLDGTLALSGELNGVEVKNGASAVDNYIDVWTVKMTEDSEYQVFINNFHLYNDNYIALTEPLLLSTKNRLVTKHVNLDSVTDLKVTTSMVVENKNLDDSVRNIIQDFSISGAKIKLEKINEDSAVAPRENIYDFVDADSVTGDNTIIFRLDADQNGLVLGGLRGSVTGTYALTVKYGFMGQIIVSEPFYFTVR